MKKLVLIFTLMLLLTGCGGGSNAKLEDVDKAVFAAIDTTVTFSERDADYINYMIGIGEEQYAECTVKVGMYGTSTDEYGIFKAEDSAGAKALATALESYLKSLEGDSLRFSYTPEELPKVQNAEVTTQGSFVMYAILGEEARLAATEAFNKATK